MSDNKIDRMGARRTVGNPAWSKDPTTGRGRSGNPGGRPKIAEAWKAATGGKSTADVTAAALKLVWDRATKGPSPNHFGDPNDPDWRFAVQKVLEYSAGKPREELEIVSSSTAPSLDPSSMSDEQIEAGLNAIATLRKLVNVAAPDDDDAPTEH